MSLTDIIIVGFVLCLFLFMTRKVIQSSRKGQCSGCGCGGHKPTWLDQYKQKNSKK